MITFNRKTAIASIVLLATVAAPSFAEIGFEREQNTAFIRRYVLLENADGLPVNVRAIVARELLRTLTASRGQAAPKAGDITFLSLTTPSANIAYGESGDFQLADDAVLQTLNVGIFFPEQTDGDAEALVQQRWDEARVKLQDALRRAQRRTVSQKDSRLIAKLRLLESQRDRATREIDQIRAAFEGLDNPAPVEQLRDQLVSARQTLSELALNRVSAEARREAIVARIDELREAAIKATADDPLIAELENLVGIREQQLKHARTLSAAGTVTTVELGEAETEMARARVELLKAQRAATTDAAGGVMQELNNELSRLIVQLAEIDARMKALEPTVVELREATSAGAAIRDGTLRENLTGFQTRLVNIESAIATLESDAQQTEMPEIRITPLDEALSLGEVNEDDVNEGVESGGDDNTPQNE
jgi:hypothetical protein